MGGSPPAAVAIFTRQQPQSQSILILGRRRKRGCRSLLEPDSRPQVEGHGQRQGACVCCLTAAAGPAKVLVFTVAVWFIVMASGSCCVCGGGSHCVSRVMSLWSYVLPCWSTARCHPGGSIPSCIAGFPLGTFWELSSEHDTQPLRRTSTVRARQRSLSEYARQRAPWLVWTSLCPPQDTETVRTLPFSLQLFHLLQHPLPVSLPTPVLICTAIASDPLPVPGPSSLLISRAFFSFFPCNHFINK